MLEHYPKFEAYLNRFNTRLKDMTATHVKYIRKMGEWERQLRASTKDILHEIQVGVKRLELHDETDKIQLLLNYGALGIQLEKAEQTFHKIFEQHIDETNKIFGAFSSHWGSYIESVGVIHVLNYLQKHRGVHTSYQQFNRKMDKQRVSIDLVALSATHCYVIDVKNQLKVEHLVSLEKNLWKLRAIAPEYHHLVMQPILVCFHADPAMENYLQEHQSTWVLRYHGFDKEQPKNSFSWLYGG
jgi:hypothetical protein